MSPYIKKTLKDSVDDLPWVPVKDACGTRLMPLVCRGFPDKPLHPSNGYSSFTRSGHERI